MDTFRNPDRPVNANRPRCPQCNAPLDSFEGERYCQFCWSYAPAAGLCQLVDADPDIEAERRAWREACDGEDIIILSDDDDRGR
jgi:hypothetical protein